MCRKKISIHILCILVIFSSCTSSKKTKEPKLNIEQGLTPEEATQLQVPEIQKQEILYEEVVSSETTQQSPKNFAVWIEGDLLDSFAALGFLQQLEKKSIKPVAIMGSGFACYIAVSWGIENSGNQAEWQTFKWNKWNSLTKGLFQKIGVGSTLNDFEEEMSKMLSVKEFHDLKIPVDCPLWSKEGSYHTAHSMNLIKALWHQFQVPHLGNIEDERMNFYSGFIGATVTPEELDEWADKSKVKIDSWIILKTQPEISLSKEKASPWEAIYEKRLKLKPDSSSGTTPKNLLPWKRIQVLSSKSVQDIKSFTLRRRWLLDGRTAANRFLLQPEAGNYFDISGSQSN